MRNAGSALMGMGHATGDNRAQIAAEQAISSPLLEQTNIAGAVGMIVNITAPPDFMMHELDDAMGVIQDTAPDAQIIFGLVYKDELELGDEVLVTVIATGFDSVGEEAYGIDDSNTSARHDDTDTYQRQPQGLPPTPSRVRQNIARTPSDRARVPGRGRRGTNAEPPVEEDKAPQNNQQKPARGRDQDSRQRETDWEIPAFLRVQKRRGNDK